MKPCPIPCLLGLLGLPALLVPNSVPGAALDFAPNEIIDVSNGSTRNERPRVLFTDDGRSHVVWARGEFSQEGAYISSADSDGLYGSPIQLSELNGITTGEGYGPTLRTKGSHLVVGWEDKDTGNRAAFAIASPDMGLTWDEPLRADPGTNETRVYQSVGVFPDGKLSQIWMKYDDQNLTNPRIEWTVQEGSGLFGAPIVATSLAGIVCECCSPSQTVLSDGTTVLLAFRRNNLNIRENYVVRSTDGGSSFTQLSRVDTSGWFIPGCPGSGPFIVADGQNVLVTFFSAGTGISHVYTARSTNGGETWDPMVQVDDEVTASVVNYPQVALRGDIAVLVWEGLGPEGFPDIYAALSIDGGQTWGEPVVVTDDGGTLQQREPTVAISPSYEVEVIWKDRRTGANRLFRSRADALEPASVEAALPAPRLDMGLPFPNPSRSDVSVSFSLAEPGPVQIVAHDASGRVVARVAHEWFGAGTHRVVWEPDAVEGSGPASGHYTLRLSTARSSEARSVVLLR